MLKDHRIVYINTSHLRTQDKAHNPAMNISFQRSATGRKQMVVDFMNMCVYVCVCTHTHTYCIYIHTHTHTHTFKGKQQNNISILCNSVPVNLYYNAKFVNHLFELFWAIRVFQMQKSYSGHQMVYSG